MIHTRNLVHFFALYSLLQFTLPLLSDSPQRQVSADITQLKERAIKLNELFGTFQNALTKVNNKISETIKLTKKYGKGIDKDTLTKKMLASKDALERFMQLRIRSIQHYLQQDTTTIPTEGYQEIYEAIDSIVRAATNLVKNLDEHVQSNFKKEFDFSFLINKDLLSLTEEGVSLETVSKRCTELVEATEALFESSNRIGLTTWNKIARVINRLAVQPCNDYHLLPTAGITGFFALSFIYTYWMSYCPRLYSKQDQTEMLRIAEQIKDLYEQRSKASTTDALDKIERDLRDLAEVLAKKVSPEHEKIQLEELDWFAKILVKYLGKPPVRMPDGTLNLDVNKTEKTYWNGFITFLHNALAQSPIQGVIQTGAVAFFSSYMKPIIWPRFSATIKAWWQHSLGGRHTEMQQEGNFVSEIEWTFDQVIGLEHIKARFDTVLAYAEDPIKFAQIGASIATNYIFYGVKRTGKSFFAVALAGEMKRRNPNMRILKIPSALFREIGVQQTIDLIRAHAPCVVFIDEVDIAGFSRAMDRQTTGDLLKALGNGNISPSPDRPVFLLFATNKLESIDTSLTSLGRFGPSILFSTPAYIDRVQFVHAILMTEGQNPETLDIYRLAERTEGFSFEDIKYCISAAILRASVENIALSTELIMEVMNEILFGVYPEYPIELHPETRKVIAAHYAGKALVATLMKSHEELDTVTIHKRKLPLVEDEFSGYSGKPTRQKKYDYGMLITRQSTTVSENRIMSPALQKAYYMRQLAGMIAEEVIFGATTSRCDDEQILRMYLDLAIQYSDGVSYHLDTLLSPEQKQIYFKQVLDTVNSYKQELRELLTQNRKALDVLIRTLCLPALNGSATDGIVNMILENPDAVSEQLDAIEAEIKKQQEEYMQKQQEEYERLKNSENAPEDGTDNSTSEKQAA